MTLVLLNDLCGKVDRDAMEPQDNSPGENKLRRPCRRPVVELNCLLQIQNEII